MQSQSNIHLDATAATNSDLINNTESENSPSFHTPSLEEIEGLTNELKRLLVRYETTLEQEGIRGQIETLERWMESYRRGLSAAHKLSKNGPNWLHDLRDRLKLAADELQRLEGEGGNPATKEQVARAEELLKAMRRIDAVVPSVEHIFCPNEPLVIEETTAN